MMLMMTVVENRIEVSLKLIQNRKWQLNLKIKAKAIKAKIVKLMTDISLAVYMLQWHCHCLW